MVASYCSVFQKSAKLSNNLIYSHCTATGEPYAREVVRAMMLLRANALCFGVSGVRPVLVEKLVEMLNADDGQPIGTITDIDDQTDNWLFIVRRPDGTEALIPAHEEFIADIKKEEKTMLMDLPLGLLDL